MKTDVHILFVEDSEADVRQALRALDKGGYTPQWRQVDSEAGLREALAGGAWDLVVSDYRIPGFGGLTALEITQELAPHLPFIFLTGAMGEEAAVRLVKAGAHDFVLKGNLHRLPLVVRRELDDAREHRALLDAEAEARAARERLERSEAQFRRLVEDNLLGVAIIRNDRFLFANDSLARLFGYDSATELPREQDWRLIAPEDRERLQGYAERRWQGLPAPDSYEFCGLRRDGERIWVYNVVQAIEFEGQAAYQFTVVNIDQRKRAEQAARDSEEKHRALLEATSDGIAVMDEDWRYLMINPAGARMLGRPAEEIVGRRLPDLFPGIEDTPFFFVYQAVLEIGEPATISDVLVYPDGRRAHFEVDAYRVPQGLFIVARDITRRKEAERRLVDSERRLRDYAEVASDWFWEMGPDLRFTYLSERFEEATGLRHEDTIGLRREQISSGGEESARMARHLADLEAPRPFRDFTYAYVHGDGSTRYARVSGKPVFAADGAFLGYRGTGADVTGEMAAREAAEEAHTRLTDAIESVPAAFALYDAGERFVLGNQQLTEMYPEYGELWRPGTSYEEILRHSLAHELVPAACGEGEPWVQRRLQDFRHPPEFYEYERHDGRSVRAYDRKTADGGTVSVRMDITDLKHHHEVIRSSERRFRGLLEGSIQGVMVHRHEQPLFANRAFAEIYGFGSAAEVLSQEKLGRLVVPADRARMWEYCQARMRGEPAPSRYEFQGLRKDGVPVWIECMNTVVDWDGEPAILSTQIDVSERKRAEEELRQSQRLLQTVFDCLPLSVKVKDTEGRYVLVNRHMADRYGRAPEWFQGKHVDEAAIGTPEERDHVLDQDRLALETAGPLAEPEVPITAPDGSVRLLQTMRAAIRDETGAAVGLVSASLDVTEAQQLREQLHVAQRMEAIGRLAGGVAHDFNNILAVVLSFAGFLEEVHPAGDPAREDVEEVLAAGHRGTALTRQLLAFSRRQVQRLEVLDLDEVIEGMQKMLARLIGEDVELRVQPAGELEATRADVSQIEQVVMNLAVNARDAMPHGGRLTIETANVALDEAYTREHAGVRPGRYVMLAVSDTGSGMDEATRQHIFEPFFTTKEQGKGTGLGLATVYGIVKQTGGHVWVYSEPGRGTTFKVYLPCAEEKDAAVEGPRAAVERAPAHGTVLVVEDEDAVRRAVRRILEEAGYRVMAANGGTDAIARYEQEGQAVDLLLTDVVMPGMSGRELFNRLAMRQTDLHALYMSGYTESAIVHHGVLEEGVHLVHKPFTRQSLLDMVARAMPSRESAA